MTGFVLYRFPYVETHQSKLTNCDNIQYKTYCMSASFIRERSFLIVFNLKEMPSRPTQGMFFLHNWLVLGVNAFTKKQRK